MSDVDKVKTELWGHLRDAISQSLQKYDAYLSSEFVILSLNKDVSLPKNLNCDINVSLPNPNPKVDPNCEKVDPILKDIVQNDPVGSFCPLENEKEKDFFANLYRNYSKQSTTDENSNSNSAQVHNDDQQLTTTAGGNSNSSSSDANSTQVHNDDQQLIVTTGENSNISGSGGVSSGSFSGLGHYLREGIASRVMRKSTVDILETFSYLPEPDAKPSFSIIIPNKTMEENITVFCSTLSDLHLKQVTIQEKARQLAKEFVGVYEKEIREEKIYLLSLVQRVCKF